MIIAVCPQNWFLLLLINTYIPVSNKVLPPRRLILKLSVFVRRNVGHRVYTQKVGEKKMVKIAPRTYGLWYANL